MTLLSAIPAPLRVVLFTVGGAALAYSLVIALLSDIPTPLRWLLLAIGGAVIGAAVNWAVYAFAWDRRGTNPWVSPPPKAQPRHWSDRLPILGWLALRREAKFFGAGFWIRPLGVELGMLLAVPALYWWEVERCALVPNLQPPFTLLPPYLLCQFVAHVTLLALMLAASLIDVDERIIPDAITVPGTLLGLILAGAMPWLHLPLAWNQLNLSPVPPALGADVVDDQGLPPIVNGFPQRIYLSLMTATAPSEWPAALAGAPNLRSLLVGLGCFWFWCFAIVERPWYPRHGLRRALAVATAHAWRQLRTPPWPHAALALAGSLGIAGVWTLGGPHWVGLLTSLVGLAGAGAPIWAVRVIGAATLKKEAMGFGDVTLMMMIGTIVSWQAGLLIFFVAPFFGLVIGVAQLAFSRDQAIPYGPFLCLATAVIIVRWASVWGWAENVFALGWYIPLALACIFAALAVSLSIWRVIREAVFGE